MHHPKGFPSRLVRLRADAGMTQRDLAKASGLSVPQIGRYEMGTSTPRMTALVKLAKALKVDVSELENSEDEPETVELEMLTDGHPSTMFTLPRSLVEELQADASRRGVSLEVILAATLSHARSRDEGRTNSLDEIVAEIAAEYDSLPPLN
ncbi:MULTISPECIES: helix-turn-helix domain-containing protein [unclassified Pseudomonas]|uniref:helix-turn-helix domain-containing protein n=1 Tax=unclassified Pseudomonas TaxID=196821 RepID=UPI0030DD6FF2